MSETDDDQRVCATKKKQRKAQFQILSSNGSHQAKTNSVQSAKVNDGMSTKRNFPTSTSNQLTRLQVQKMSTTRGWYCLIWVLESLLHPSNEMQKCVYVLTCVLLLSSRCCRRVGVRRILLWYKMCDSVVRKKCVWMLVRLRGRYSL